MLIKRCFQRTRSTRHCTPRRIEDNKYSYTSFTADLIDRTLSNADNIY